MGDERSTSKNADNTQVETTCKVKWNMVQYHDTIRMVNFINPTSTIGIVVDLYPLYSASLPVVPVVRYDYGS